MNNRNYEIHRYEALNTIAREGAAVVFGSDEELMLPINELSRFFEINENIVNRSFVGLGVQEAAGLYRDCVAAIKPAKVLIRVGNDDKDLYLADCEDFDRAYMELIAVVKKENSKCSIALLSVNDRELNEHIRGIAASCGCAYCDVASARLEDVRTVLDVYNTGFVRQLKKELSVTLITRMLYSIMNESAAEAEVTSKSEARHGLMRFLRLANA